MRKNRGWSENTIINLIDVSKPSSLQASLFDNIITFKWICSIGKVEGYKIYGGKDSSSLSLLGETTTNSFIKKIENDELPYYAKVTAFYNGIESEATTIIEVKKVINNYNQVQNILNIQTISSQAKNTQTEIKEEIKEQKLLVDESFPYGLCSCCSSPKPLMKMKNEIICSKNKKQIYIQDGNKFVKQKSYILSDLDEIDKLLRKNSAYVGVNGVLLNKNNFNN